MTTLYLQIALDTPLDRLFDYRWRDAVNSSDRSLFREAHLYDCTASIAEAEFGRAVSRAEVPSIESDASDHLEKAAAKPTSPQVGQLVMVPFGKRTVMGLIVGISKKTEVPEEKLKDVIDINNQVQALGSEWINLCRFAADYYQRPLGEVSLPALPRQLKVGKPTSIARYLKKLSVSQPSKHTADQIAPALNPEQQTAVDRIASGTGFVPFLLYGVTGSGKTEVYLQAAARILAKSEEAQVLILVPEINLTPQLENNIRLRFANEHIATQHSGLAEGERLLHWLAAHHGKARIVLGTRLAILASMPNLQLIIVDEEHDPSYKQQEGLRYSARDLAVWRAHQLGIPVVLGSATPSLESWQQAHTHRYQKLILRERAVKNAVLPVVKLVNLVHEKPTEGLTPRLIGAIKQRLEKSEQSLLFLNRRGYAPVIACEACGWISNCTRCTAHLVLHKLDKRLRCHHCGLEQTIPKRCPTCGNVDLQPLGRGTQRLEESLQQLFPQARVFRIDADSTRLKGSAETAFERVHNGEVDILIGTQMVAKGHDFQNLSLVAALNPDSALFSQDFRASERLFAQLMQVAGRAGRTAQKADGNMSEVLIQTRYPDHPLYHALIAHDYERFAADVLDERKQAHMPPFIYQALLRAEAAELKTALDFLHQAATCLQQEGIIINDPIPMTMTRVANRDRAQLLVESSSRPALQAFLKTWISELRAMKSRVKWGIEIDPVEI